MKYQVGDLFVSKADVMMYIEECIDATQYKVCFFERNNKVYKCTYHISSLDCMIQINAGWKHYPIGKHI
jgi:hypothetical protein